MAQKNWAIAIGINQYRFLQPLRYAKRDAEAMRQFLETEAGFDRIFFFSDDSPPVNGKSTEPFRANILRVLRQVFETPFMGDGDNFWFFFSGHGIRHQERDYLMPLDGDPEDVENTGIPTTYITERLRRCGADNVVMMLDACRSEGRKSGVGIGQQTEEEARQTGVISIFSCSPEQYSYELEAIQQGAFTAALLEGLGIRGRCATVERLNQYLEKRVPELVSQHLNRARQVPYAIAEPIARSHLILMPHYASLADIAVLKNDAARAERRQEWDLAQRLWIRVLAAAAGQDMDAIEALQHIAQQRLSQPLAREPSPPTSPAQEIGYPSPFLPNQIPPTQPASPPAQSPSFKPPTQKSVPAAASLRQPLTSSPGSQRASTSPRPSASTPRSRRQVLTWVSLGSGGLLLAIGLGQWQNSASNDASDLPDDSSSNQEVASSNETLSNAIADGTVDYSRLEGFLQGQQWKEADQTTADLMLKVANREEEGWLDIDSINTFPCEVLSEIDRLWVQYSDGKFGFSVQSKIYFEDCGGDPSGEYDEAWQCFGDRVGWRENNQWVSYSDMTFEIQELPGHFPLPGSGMGWNDLLWELKQISTIDSTHYETLSVENYFLFKTMVCTNVSFQGLFLAKNF